VVESAETTELFANILHPYTRGLLNSLPSIDSDTEWLDAIPGRVPTLEEQLDGCAFHPRCAFAKAQCSTSLPGLLSRKGQHLSRCHFVGELPL
ncbi:MAG: oligopeptide/dipeptide ABC transporter ATP-binding protein, partial [Granulosicoccus sp.]